MFIERFIKYLQFEKRFSPHTVLAYQKDLQQFSGFLEQRKLNFTAADHTHIKSWLVELLDQGADAKTVNRKASSLRTFYRFLLQQQVLVKNPMLQVQSLKTAKRLPVVMEEQNMDALLDSETAFESNFAGLRDRLVLEILYGTGVRCSELVNLKETDIDSFNQQLKVLGKRNKERIIPINKSLMKLIEEYMLAKKGKGVDNKSSALIVTNEGKSAYPKFIYRIVKSYLSTISTSDKRSPHVLRHTFATSLLNHGAELNAIKELLGHASLAATQIYTHNSVERLKTIYKQAHPKG